MKRERYMEIRSRENFLYIYFREKSNISLSESDFNTLFTLWLSTVVRMSRMEGISRILDFLDKKHIVN